MSIMVVLKVAYYEILESTVGKRSVVKRKAPKMAQLGFLQEK